MTATTLSRARFSFSAQRAKIAIIFIAIFALYGVLTARAHAQDDSRFYGSRPEVQRWVDDMAARRNLDAAWVRDVMAQARFLPNVPRLVLPPARGTAKNWRVYRSRFIDPVRTRAGVRFWQQHSDALARAERQFGVPAEIIVGIIGVETIYGQNTGNVRVLDALSTLTFDFPPQHPRAAARQAFFQDELEQYLQSAQRSGTDPTLQRGSFAGAMGLPQFMPSSFVKYAIDFDGDGRVDLNNPVDAIGSVANYFKGYGWVPGQPTHYPVTLNAQTDMATLLAPDILPSFTTERFAQLGADLPPNARAHKGPLALVELENGNDAPQYIAGTENFYVITRYNWSSYYAMAVIELGQSVKRAMNRAD